MILVTVNFLQTGGKGEARSSIRWPFLANIYSSRHIFSIGPSNTSQSKGEKILIENLLSAVMILIVLTISYGIWVRGY